MIWAWRFCFRPFGFPVRWPDNPQGVATGASDLHIASASRKANTTGLWVAYRELSPPIASAMVATLDVLSLVSFDLPPDNFTDFLRMALIRIFFWQCFYLWFVRVFLVHCSLAFPSSSFFWAILVYVSAHSLCIIFGLGAAFPLSTFSTFFFTWSTLFALTMYIAFFVDFCYRGSKILRTSEYTKPGRRTSGNTSWETKAKVKI